MVEQEWKLVLRRTKMPTEHENENKEHWTRFETNQKDIHEEKKQNKNRKRTKL
jgi:hypothetical protein